MTLSLARSLLLICAGLVHTVSPDRDSPVNTIIGQTFNLARLMKSNSTILLNTYLSHQGSPFSDSGFDARRLHYEGVPTAAIPFLEWRTLSHVKRVEKNYEAYTAFAEFLQLVRDDQFELNPTKVELLDMLKVTRLRIQGLLSNLTAIMSALGAPPAAITDPLMLESVEADTFEKKIRGYVVCHTYKEWIDRTVKDFSLLAEKFPA